MPTVSGDVRFSGKKRILYPLVQRSAIDAFRIWRDAGFESVMNSEADVHQALQFKLIFVVPVDGWSLVAAARCRATGMTADLASTALITVRYPQPNRHRRRGTVDYQTSTMDIFDYLKQGGQTAGHPRTAAVT
jgi:hypothetical protein